MRGPPLPWVAILGAAVASPPPAPAFNATAAFARFLAVETWWLGQGEVPAPPWWTVTAFGNLSARAAPKPDVDTAPTPDVDALDRGNSKDVRRAAARDGAGGEAPVVVKRPRGATHARFSETYTEILYLEYLRGLPGIPALHGGWFEDVPPSAELRHDPNHRRRPSRRTNRTTARVAYVVGDAGAVLGTARGRAAHDEWVRESPLDAARAWLRLGRSFAEVGGFLLTDFKPGQFAVDGATVALVDAPRPQSGPVADYLRRQDLAARRHVPASLEDPQGFLREDVRCAAARAADENCRATTPLHCCCNPKHADGRRQRDACGRARAPTGRGAPEAVGYCTANRTCAALSAKTHVFDFANRAWILGAVRDAATGPEADALAALMARMSAPDPDDRPTFAGALALLDRWNASRQGS